MYKKQTYKNKHKNAKRKKIMMTAMAISLRQPFILRSPALSFPNLECMDY